MSHICVTLYLCATFLSCFFANVAGAASENNLHSSNGPLRRLPPISTFGFPGLPPLPLLPPLIVPAGKPIIPRGDDSVSVGLAVREVVSETQFNGAFSLISLVAELGQTCEEACHSRGLGCAESFQQELDGNPFQCRDAARCESDLSGSALPFSLDGDEPSGCIVSDVLGVALTNNQRRPLSWGCLAFSGPIQLDGNDKGLFDTSFRRVCLCDILPDNALTETEDAANEIKNGLRFPSSTDWLLAAAGQTCSDKCSEVGSCDEDLQERVDSQLGFCQAAAVMATGAQTEVVQGPNTELSGCDAAGCVLRAGSLVDNEHDRVLDLLLRPFGTHSNVDLPPNIVGVAALNTRNGAKGCDAPAAPNSLPAASVRVCACTL